MLVAGGQGSRLGYDGPKGCYEIGPVSGAPLFEIHAKKLLSLEKEFGAPVPWYVMTSEVNDAPTRAFFEANEYFGLSADNVMFFQQGMYPALTQDGQLILDRPDHIFMSPDGHGGLLTALKKNGMFDDMNARGLKTLYYFQVDNPLLEIADPAFIGAHLNAGADASVKVCAKTGPEEGIGVVVVRDGKTRVVEYSELTDEQAQETTADGELRLKYGSVAIHVFQIEFLKKAYEEGLPLHLAHKKVPYVNKAGETLRPDSPNAYKFEKFIFDTFPMADNVLCLAFQRKDEFSPVKNATGVDSADWSRRDMVRKAARWLEACGVDVAYGDDGEPVHKIEIDPCYARNVEQLRERLPDGFTLTADTYLSV